MKTSQLKMLRLRQLERSIQPWKAIHDRPSPPGGWIRTVREALGMSASQLGARLGLSRQAVADLERREQSGAVTLATLQRAAAAMNADVVYAIVPRQPLAEMLRDQARRKAEQELKRIAHSMRLEAQAVSPDEYQRQVADNADALMTKWSRRLWDWEGK